jgi:cell division septum initiation protein DivIVA
MLKQIIIAALEKELAGYERRGLKDRANQVRQELTRLGHSMTTIVETVQAETVNTLTDAVSDAQTAVERVKKAASTQTPKPSKTTRKK